MAPTSDTQQSAASSASPRTSDAGASDASDADADAASAPVLEEPATPPVEEEPPPPPIEEDPPPPLGGPVDDPGPPPASTCSVTKDANGFFTHGNYVAYVPPGYDGTTPARLLVGLHGCGDNAKNFATWAVAPWDTRKT